MLPGIPQQPVISAPRRHALLAQGTNSKLAVTVRRHRLIGMICANWPHDAPRWHPNTFNDMRAFTQQVVAPVLEAALTLATIDHPLRSIRTKLGVSSTARLVRLLNHHDPCTSTSAASG